MKFYLSSYKFGNNTQKLQTMLPKGSRFGHINNAKDFTGHDPVRKANHQNEEISILQSLGFEAEALDLTAYFGRQTALREKLLQLEALWVSGGNTFILRQAMSLSGFDELFEELKHNKDFLYAGYSAGMCVLCDSLKYIEMVDNPNDFPYPESTTAIWDGLGVFNFGLLPHYNSNHYESEAIGKEVQRCIDNKWLFKALKDGEVIIIE